MAINKKIEKEIQKIYEEVYKKVFTEKRLKKILKNNDSNDIKIAIKNIEGSRAYKKFAKEFAKRLARAGINQQKGLWRKYYEAAKKNKVGILPPTYSKFEIQQMNKAINHNFKMIKSIPQEVFKMFKEKSVKVLLRQTALGTTGRGTFKAFLEEKGVKNAKLIARTETAKLQSKIVENESTDLGSIVYIWKSTHDKRTRSSHKAMNGVVVFWRRSDNEKPLLDNMNGNAGEFPNCRCRPEPVFDERDLKQGKFKVYNYRTHKIINMSKGALIEAMKQGGL